VYREFVLINSTVQWICKNRTKVISAFERNGLIIKRFRKPEWGGVNEALLQWCEQQRSDNEPMSGPRLMVTVFFLNFKFKLMHFCMELYNYIRAIFIISKL